VDFSATDDASIAFRLLIHERWALARTAGPSFVLFCLLPLTFVGIKNWNPSTTGQAQIALWLLVGFLVALFCLPLIGAIRWARYLVKGEIPSLIAIPWKPFWGVLWRLFFVGFILRFVNGSEPWLQSQLPQAPHWAVSAIAAASTLAVLVLASPRGVIFIMVAVEAKDRSLMSALRAAHSVGRRFYLGMLLILAPQAVLAWLQNFLPEAPASKAFTLVDWTEYASWGFVLFLTIIAATTYLARIYIRSPLGETEFGAAGGEAAA
jgi:hypothetical protein